MSKRGVYSAVVVVLFFYLQRVLAKRKFWIVLMISGPKGIVFGA